MFATANHVTSCNFASKKGNKGKSDYGRAITLKINSWMFLGSGISNSRFFIIAEVQPEPQWDLVTLRRPETCLECDSI